MFYEQKMTSLVVPEFWRFWKGQKEAGRGQKRPEGARRGPGRGQKRPGRGQEEARKRPEEARKARNPEFGEKLLEMQCFMNRK